MLFARARAVRLRAGSRSFRWSGCDFARVCVHVGRYLVARHLRVGLVPGVEQDAASWTVAGITVGVDGFTALPADTLKGAMTRRYPHPLKSHA